MLQPWYFKRSSRGVNQIPFSVISVKKGILNVIPNGAKGLPYPEDSSVDSLHMILLNNLKDGICI